MSIIKPSTAIIPNLWLAKPRTAANGESFSIVSPYSRFNLRRNPFGELTRQERAELAVVDVRPWLKLLQRQTKALQFMGHKGEGKTTHMLALERSLPGASYVYLPEDGPLPPIPSHRPLLIDEVQRLTPKRRRVVFEHGGPIVLGTHENLSQELHTAGLEVTTVNVASGQSAKRLAEILNARIASSRISIAPVPGIEIEYANQLIRDFGNNVRAIEQFLYDEFQTAVQTGSPWPNAS